MLETQTHALKLLPLVGMLLFACGRTSAANDGQYDELPNVVLIISDDQAWDDYGFMGHAHIETPHLDRLASQSLVYDRGYVPTSLCRPSLATLVTGLHAVQHGITGNDPRPPAIIEDDQLSNADRRRRLLDANLKLISRIEKLPTLPRLLADKGYVSFQSGKWWEGSYQTAGFSNGMTHGDPARGGRHGDLGLEVGRKSMEPVLNFISQNKQRPFFVWYAPFLPHTPHNPPAELLEKYELIPNMNPRMARYFAMCEWFDQSCGELMGHLDDEGLSQNTLVIYVTDNGWIQRTEQTEVPEGWRSQFAPRSKQTPYEGGIRTPIMVRWPARVEPARDQTHLASSIDIAPTILAACQLDIPEPMAGLDLLDAEAVAARKMIWGEVFAHDMPDPDRPRAGLNYRWAIRDDLKLVTFFPGQNQRYSAYHRRASLEPELYKILADPYENENLASSQPETVSKLKRELDAAAEQLKLIQVRR